MFYRGVAALAMTWLLVAASPRSARADARAGATRAWSVDAEIGASLGLNFPSLLRAVATVGRRFVNRFDVAVGVRLGTASDALLLEPGARLAVLFHLADKLDLHLGWWIGYASVSKELPNGRLRLDMFAATLMLALTYRLSDRFELRATPVGGSAYLADGIWASSVELSAGLAVRF